MNTNQLKWTKIFNQFKKSGLTKSQFAKKNKIALSQFYKYAREFAPELINKNLSLKCQTNSSELSFLKVHDSTMNENTHFKLLVNGNEIDFTSLPDPKWLATFMSEVENVVTSI